MVYFIFVGIEADYLEVFGEGLGRGKPT